MRPFATQNPTLPKDFRQLRQGTLNRLQNAAMTTAPMGTENTNLGTKPVGPDVTSAPDANRKTTTLDAVRRARRIRY